MKTTFGSHVDASLLPMNIKQNRTQTIAKIISQITLLSHDVITIGVCQLASN